MRRGLIYSLITQASARELTFFRPPEKKRIFLFSCGGDPVQNRPQDSVSGGCRFSTRKSRSEAPERGDVGEEKYLEKGGADRAKKGKKDAQKIHGWR